MVLRCAIAVLLAASSARADDDFYYALDDGVIVAPCAHDEPARVLRANGPPTTLRGSFFCRGAALPAEHVFANHAYNEVQAFDVQTGARLWHRPWDVGAEGEIDSMTAVGSHVIILVTGGRGRVTGELDGQIFALGARTGVVRPLLGVRAGHGADPPLIMPAGDRLIAAVGDAVQAIDPASGRALWTYELRGRRRWAFHAGERIVAIGLFSERAGSSADLILLDAANGRVRARVTIPSAEDDDRNPASELYVHGDEIYAVVPVRVQGLPGQRVVALDGTGAVRWRSEPAPSSDYPEENGSFSVLRVAGELLYARTSDGVLRTFRRSDGRLEWHYGLHSLSAVGVSRDGSTLVANDHEWNDVILDRAAPAVTVRVRGRVRVRGQGQRGRHWVQVGTELVRSDATGRFTANVEARGAIRIAAFPIDAFGHALTIAVQIPASGPRTRSVVAEIDGCGTFCWD